MQDVSWGAWLAALVPIGLALGVAVALGRLLRMSRRQKKLLLKRHVRRFWQRLEARAPKDPVAMTSPCYTRRRLFPSRKPSGMSSS